MLLIDERDGSKELLEPLEKLSLPAGLTRLDFGDIAFEGRGIGGKRVMIGIEHKKLEELIGSLRSNRLQGHQLPGMRGAPRPMYHFAWLLIEGELLFDKKNRLMKRIGKREFKPIAGNMTADELFKRLFNMQINAGLMWMFAKDQRHSCKLIQSLYRMWTDQDQDEHTSHLAAYEPPTLVPISDKRRTFMTFPGIGQKASLAAERAFGSIRKAVNASPSMWANLTTKDRHGNERKLGTKVADELIEYFN